MTVDSSSETGEGVGKGQKEVAKHFSRTERKELSTTNSISCEIILEEEKDSSMKENQENLSLTNLPGKHG